MGTCCYEKTTKVETTFATSGLQPFRKELSIQASAQAGHSHLSNDSKQSEEDMMDLDDKDFFVTSEDQKIKLFPLFLLKEFNSARKDPAGYSQKVLNHIKYIKTIQDANNNIFYYEYDNNYPKIFLNKGEDAFKECAQALLDQRPLHCIKLNQDIALKIPDDAPKDFFNSKDKLLELLKAHRTNLLAEKFSLVLFHYDNGFINHEQSALLQIVDDTNSQCLRRKNIFHQNIKFMGVSVAKVNSKRFFIYMTFAGE